MTRKIDGKSLTGIAVVIGMCHLPFLSTKDIGKVCGSCIDRGDCLVSICQSGVTIGGGVE